MSILAASTFDAVHKNTVLHLFDSDQHCCRKKLGVAYGKPPAIRRLLKTPPPYVFYFNTQLSC